MANSPLYKYTHTHTHTHIYIYPYDDACNLVHIYLGTEESIESYRYQSITRVRSAWKQHFDRTQRPSIFHFDPRHKMPGYETVIPGSSANPGANNLILFDSNDASLCYKENI